jgi:hypothetical protein
MVEGMITRSPGEPSSSITPLPRGRGSCQAAYQAPFANQMEVGSTDCARGQRYDCVNPLPCLVLPHRLSGYRRFRETQQLS